MLTRNTIEFLRSRSYEPDAERLWLALPFSSIYWSDEIPDFASLRQLSDECYEQVLRLLGIRLQIWNEVDLAIEDQEFWNAAIALVPDCPIFLRLVLSEQDRETQLNVEQTTDQFLDEMAEAADHFKIDQDGNWSALFHGDQEVQATTWWQRLAWWFGRRR
ncbi:MAG: hypothetical protein AAGA50_25345 [Pseudomonadota bacterium]